MKESYDHEGQRRDEPDLSRFTENSTLGDGYRVSLLLRLQNAKCDPDSFDADAFAAVLGIFAHDVSVRREGTAVRVSSVTDEPDRLLAEAQKYGEYLTVDITNPAVWDVPEARRPRKPFGVVAAAGGDGIRDTLLSMGADSVPDSRQTLTAKDLASACRGINADCVLLFPNSRALQGAAEAAADACAECDVRVIPCDNVGACCAALSMLDTSSGDPDAVAADMTALADEAVTGVVVPADGGFAGISEGRPAVNAPDRPAAALALAESLRASRADVLLLIAGAAVPADEARSLYEKLAGDLRRTEVIMIDGGQTDSDYILTLES
ncbi:MAG: hypothetical protein MJ192_09325 [Clostridia bacterium]|nr:hypothetical protein [Clostridia bacterium]